MPGTRSKLARVSSRVCCLAQAAGPTAATAASTQRRHVILCNDVGMIGQSGNFEARKGRCDTTMQGLYIGVGFRF